MKIKSKTPTIDENTRHRAKAVARKREINKIKIDIENGCYKSEEQIYEPSFRGTHAIDREMRVKYKRRVWQALGILIAIPILYVVIINLFDL